MDKPTYFTDNHAVGMTLRDYFAAKAMQEFCKEFDDDEHTAKIAYKVADAMLKARGE